LKGIVYKAYPLSIFFRFQDDRIMGLAPDGAGPERVDSKTGDQVPVHMGDHVAQQFIVHFNRFEKVVKGGCHHRDFFHHVLPYLPVQVEEFGYMVLGDNEGVAGEKLVAVEESVTPLQLRDPEVGFIEPFGAHGTGLHGKRAFSAISA
jgi:hypothetical protein